MSSIAILENCDPRSPGKIIPEPSASARASRSTFIARDDTGTRCGRRDFMRSPGISHTRAPRAAPSAIGRYRATRLTWTMTTRAAGRTWGRSAILFPRVYLQRLVVRKQEQRRRVPSCSRGVYRPCYPPALRFLLPYKHEVVTLVITRVTGDRVICFRIKSYACKDDSP